MKKCFSTFFVMVLLIFICTCLFSAIQVGVTVNETFETDHPYLNNGQAGLVYERVFYYPNAGFISLHFLAFDLAPGDFVEITDINATLRYTYDGKGKIVANGEKRISQFWATHIPGDTAVVKLYSQNPNMAGYGFIIDKWVRGYDPEIIKSLLTTMDIPDGIESICSNDDKEQAKCYSGTTMYDRSKAVCRLLINGSSACTGWLIGNAGHVITNNHCIGNQTDANNTDFEFMAEGSSCSTVCSGWLSCPGTVAANSGTLIKTSTTLDYALVKLPTNLSTTYGYLQLRNSLPAIGERIYIPQHPSAEGKQIAVNSDMDSGGYCKIGSTNQSPCMGGPGDIGYYGDTEGGSSGSPVIAYSDNLVVALHHCGTCPNKGVPIPSIITDLGSNLPPNAIPTTGVVTITTQPVNKSVTVGQTATFSVAASGAAPLSYQWYKGTAAISGATSASYTTPAAVIGDNGATFYVKVSNSVNSVNSNTVTLTVTSSNTPPTASFTVTPASGTTATVFNVNASGSSDAQDATSALQVRWDWENNGTWDTAFSATKTAAHQYGANGTYTIKMEVRDTGGLSSATTKQVTVASTSHTVGNTTIYSNNSTNTSLTAQPATMPENGTISSISMYHAAGSGSVLFAVYDGATAPANRLAVTASTAVSATAGWQTLNLTSPLTVASGAKIWLAWVYQTNPGIRYQAGTPSRARGTTTWSSGMPSPFGSSTIGTDVYSIYANYTPSGAPTQYTLTTNTVGSGSVALNPAGGTYNSGTSVTLTATPVSGWTFSAWSGGLTGSTNPATITMNANKSVTATFTQSGGTNLALNKPITGSSTLSGYPATNAVDGSTTTYWVTVALTSTNKTQWIRVDLGSAQSVSTAKIQFSTNNYARTFAIQSSSDGSTWATLTTVTTGTGGVNTVTIPATSARYFRVYMTVNNATYYTIYELQLFQ